MVDVSVISIVALTPALQWMQMLTQMPMLKARFIQISSSLAMSTWLVPLEGPVVLSESGISTRRARQMTMMIPTPRTDALQPARTAIRSFNPRVYSGLTSSAIRPTVLLYAGIAQTSRTSVTMICLDTDEKSTILMATWCHRVGAAAASKGRPVQQGGICQDQRWSEGAVDIPCTNSKVSRIIHRPSPAKIQSLEIASTIATNISQRTTIMSSCTQRTV